jgi:hypothetical protein
MSAPSALILGWGNSTARQLRTFARLWRDLGCEPTVFVPSTLRSLVDPDYFMRQARALALSPPRFVHALSDNGFIAWSMVLAELRRRAAPLPAAVVLDSCPGIAQWKTRRGFAAAFGRGLTPSALRALGRPADAAHPFVTKVIELAFRGVHRALPRSIELITSAPRRVLELLPAPTPHLMVFGPGDQPVPEAESLAFATALRDRGHPVETLRVQGSAHVEHLRREPEAYRRATRSLIAGR